MILLEEVSTPKESVNKVANLIKDKFNSKEYDFDETIDNINFWCHNDKEHTVYIQEDESYATVCENDFNESDNFNELVDSIKYQLDNT